MAGAGRRHACRARAAAAASRLCCRRRRRWRRLRRPPHPHRPPRRHPTPSCLRGFVACLRRPGPVARCAGDARRRTAPRGSCRTGAPALAREWRFGRHARRPGLDDSGLGLAAGRRRRTRRPRLRPHPPRRRRSTRERPARRRPPPARRIATRRRGADADMDLDAFDLDVPELRGRCRQSRGNGECRQLYPTAGPDRELISVPAARAGPAVAARRGGAVGGRLAEPRQTGYFDAVDARFFQAQLSGDTATAGKLLVPDLAS